MNRLHHGALLFAMAMAGPAMGMLVASDNASDSAYNNGWQSNDNGGSGFAAWSFSSGGTSSYFVASSTLLAGGSGADINSGSPARSLGLFSANNNGGADFANAFRNFSVPLSIGQTFSLDIAVNFRNGNKGVNLRSTGGSELFNFNVGSDNYFVNNASSGNGSIGSTYSSNTEFNLSFTQSSGSGGTWKIIRSGGVTDLDTGTYSGVAGGFQLYISETDNGSANDLYANNFQISAIPEVSPALVLPLAAAAVTTLQTLTSRRRDSDN